MCVLSRNLRPVIEMWIILSGMFMHMRLKMYKDKMKKRNISNLNSTLSIMMQTLQTAVLKKRKISNLNSTLIIMMQTLQTAVLKKRNISNLNST